MTKSFSNKNQIKLSVNLVEPKFTDRKLSPPHVESQICTSEMMLSPNHTGSSYRPHQFFKKTGTRTNDDSNSLKSRNSLSARLSVNLLGMA